MAKFKFIKEVEGEVNSYLGTPIKTGDTLELNDYLSDKARKNPNYEEVKRGPKKKVKSDDQGGSDTANG